MQKPFDGASWIWNDAEPVWNETVDLLAAFTRLLHGNSPFSFIICQKKE